MIQWIGGVVAVFLLGADASTTTSTITTTPTMTTRLFHRQCVRKHCCSTRKKRESIGTLIRFQRPTSDRVSRWFSSSFRDNNDNAANHDSIGMTNPCLNIEPPHENPQEDVMHVVSTTRTTTTTTTGLSSSSDDDDDNTNWWPPSYPRQGWRLLRYRQRVGFGSACYHAVRDKALEWEFQTDDDSDDVSSSSSKGIVQIHAHWREQQNQQPMIFQQQRREEDSKRGLGYVVVHNVVRGDGDLYGASSPNVLKLWSGPGGRHLATYTQVGMPKWLCWCFPKLYVVNPVSVIYDLIDQRGPGTTYTSTAYTTVRGHWLRGEERVSVFHRDDGTNNVHGGHVDVEIVSYSKPAKSVWGNLIWPFVGHLQGKFFQSQMNAFQNVAMQQQQQQHSSFVNSNIVKSRRQ